MSAKFLITHATVVTMNDARDVLYDGAILLSDERIVALGATDDLLVQYPEGERIDGTGKVILPGLINAHTHIAMSLQKGVTMSVPEGLYRVMWPVGKSLTPEDCYVGALIGGAEALKGGTTCVVDHYFHMEQVARATTELGVRGVMGHTIMSRLGPITGERELEEGIDFVKRWKGKDPLVIPWLAPHATDTVARDWLLRLRDVATAEGVGLHLHVAQSPRERDYIQELYGMGCVDYLADIGFLGPDVLAAHCLFIDTAEIDHFEASGAHPLYCPMGHALHGHPQRAWEMIQRGIGVLIGTDCVCTNNEMNLVSELRIAGTSQKQLVGDFEAMPPLKILETVTRDAADAIGMGDRLGSLAPGYLADLIMLDFDGLHAVPNYGLLDNIIYTCHGRDVNTVIVHGKVVVRDHRLTTMDEGRLVALAKERGPALIKRALASEEDLAYLWREAGRS